MKNEPDGYAVVQTDGHFVGIWRTREIAEEIVNRSPSVKGERVRPMRFTDSPTPFHCTAEFQCDKQCDHCKSVDNSNQKR